MNGYSTKQPSGNYFTTVDVVVQEVDTLKLETIAIGVITDHDPIMEEVISTALDIATVQVRAESSGDTVLGGIVRVLPSFGVLVEVAV